MATDLSPGISEHIMTQRLLRGEEISTSMGEGHAFVMEMGRQGFLTSRREVGILEGRAAAGVNATPLATPTTQ